MNRPRSMSMLVLSGLLSVPAVHAQTRGEVTNTTAAYGTAASTAIDADATADIGKQKQAFEERAAHVSAKARAKADAALQATAKAVDENVREHRDAVVGRLAVEFNSSREALMAEQTKLGTSWGNLMVAHTLALNSKSGVSAAQVVELQRAGMGWGQLAAGLGLDPKSAVVGIRNEGRAAMGQTMADGRVAVIHGAGARAGVDLGLSASTKMMPEPVLGTDIGIEMGVKPGQ